MGKVKAILFDVDGTLLDTTEYIFQAFEHTMKIHGLTSLNRKIMATYIGRLLPEIYQEIAPNIEFASLFDAHNGFQLQNLHLAKPFPGTLKVLRQIFDSNIKIAAVSTRTKENLLITLEQNGLLKFLEEVVGREDTQKHKPDPEPLFLALDKLGVNPKDAWMVGDAEPDILAGKNAGVKTVGVTYGFGGKDIAKLEPDYLIDNIENLLPVILASEASPGS